MVSETFKFTILELSHFLKNDFHKQTNYSTMSFFVVLKQPRKIILQLVVLKKTEDQLS